MLRSFQYPGFDNTHLETSPTDRFAGPTAAWFRQGVTTLQTMCGAVNESLAAHCRYEHLRSRGMPHDTAVREALGIGPGPSRGTRATKPLCFAGKA